MSQYPKDLDANYQAFVIAKIVDLGEVWKITSRDGLNETEYPKNGNPIPSVGAQYRVYEMDGFQRGVFIEVIEDGKWNIREVVTFKNAAVMRQGIDAGFCNLLAELEATANPVPKNRSDGFCEDCI